MAEPSSLLPLPCLIADVGGTNGRFALVGPDGDIGPPVIVETRAEPDFSRALATKVLPRLAERPRSAVLAWAGVPEGDRLPLSNGPWVAEPPRMIAELGLEAVAILNDFEALSLCLPELGPGDVDQIGDVPPRQDGTRLVIGPGTGLGAAALISAGGRWVPSGGEGGHVDFGPRTKRDEAIWPHLPGAHGRVSAESVISGLGMPGLYRAVAAADDKPAPLSSAPEITQAGLAGDPVAAETLSLFATYLGRYCGDLALVFMARGGVSIGGGIAPRIASVLKSGVFRRAFEAKAPWQELLATFPTAIITHKAPALLGLSALVRKPDRYAIDLTGRRWD